jgi:hypothetical protein
MGNQISLVGEDTPSTGTAHQHDTLHTDDAVEQLRRMPHMQQGSLKLEYSNDAHHSLELKLKLDAPVPCR